MNNVTTVFFLTSPLAREGVDNIVRTLSGPYDVPSDDGPQELTVEAKSTFDGEVTSVSVSGVPSNFVLERAKNHLGLVARFDQESTRQVNAYVSATVKHYRM